MERNLDIDNFERLLKERSDEFKMYPEKRVWHSIYNNIHPGKKWPSVAMSITLIAVLLLAGYLNTGSNNLNTQVAVNTTVDEKMQASSTASFYSPIVQQTPLNQTPTSLFAENSTLNFLDHSTSYKKAPLSLISEVSGNGDGSSQLVAESMTTIEGQPTSLRVFQTTDNSVAILPQISLAPNESIGLVRIENNIGLHHTINLAHSTAVNLRYLLTSVKNATSTSISGTPLLAKDKSIDNITGSTTDDDLALADANADAKPEKNSDAEATSIESEKNQLVLSDEDKNWVENYALYNRPAPKKWVGKLARQFYFTPSVIYRELKNIQESNPAEINKEVLQYPSFGLELGTGIIYPLFKGVKIKAGVQLNYTRYNAQAFTNSHPVATTITLLASESGQPYPAFRSTSYSNVDGITTVKLHNETFQISLPVGLDLKIAGNDNLQWNIGATVQPTYVAGGKSFLLSSDKRNYIKETSLLNRWNLNAGFETFVSYKTGNGVTFQFGPQFRKQIFTTNSKQYINQEKLNNFGFKFGITKLIK